MRRSILILFSALGMLSAAAQAPDSLPVYAPEMDAPPSADWLVEPVKAQAAVYRSPDGKDLILWNGLVKRVFRLQPNVACTEFKNLVSGEQLLRAVKPEARVTLDGRTCRVGGLYGQSQNAYLLPEWVDGFTAGPGDFLFQDFEVKPLVPRIHWKRNRWASQTADPAGKELVFRYRHPSESLRQVELQVHYEIYDGLPLLCKWLIIRVIHGNISTPLRIGRVVNEILAAVEEESAVVGKPERMKKPHGLYIESNYCFNNAMRAEISDQTTHWLIDSSYTSQVNYDYNTPCLLEVFPESGPGIDLGPGETFESVRTWELLSDSYDRERNGLARRRMYRTVAPWTTQNPIFMHLVSTDPVTVRAAIDQCVATGYEMVILSFGSGLDMEDTSEANILKFRQLADYAHSRGVGLGGYSLFSSRRISDADDVIDPATGLPDKAAFFGHAPCLGSRWGLGYLARLKKFFSETGFDIFENDGPYPGDVCASTVHPGHRDLADSQWRQFELQKGLYRWLNERGVYINAPDWYFLDGTHKISMGYREVNFSLPREEQIILNRQHVFDGTWEKTPSMGWMFVPLTEYQGGGEAATIEPLHEHLDVYRTLMMQNYGAGAQACYRGPRLYDTDDTRRTVKEVIDWYKRYRDILNSDIIHLRRPDGRDWDGILHVNPALREKGFLLLFNPLKVPITRRLRIPLYYTGLNGKARLLGDDGKESTLEPDREFEVEFEAVIPAGGMRWWVIGSR